MSKIETAEINLDQLRNIIGLEDNYNYTLTKVDNEDFEKRCEEVRFLEWNEDRTVKSIKFEPAIGLSLLMSPLSAGYTWLTTRITEIIKDEFGLLEFKTENNSHYILKYEE